MSSPTVPIILTDPTGQQWTKAEIQSLVNQTGSFTKTARRLGLKGTSVLRHWGILTPPEWVKARAIADPMWLPRLILQCSSVKDTAELLNVSAAHINLCLGATGFSTRLPDPDPELCKSALEKFGSVIFAARCVETTPVLFKKAVPNWKDFRDPTKVGTTSIRTGRIGELYFERCRSQHIVCSPALTNHNHPGWDHHDREFGRVNTKASVAENHRWTWDLGPNTDCDAFALVQLSLGRDPVGLVIITKKQLLDGDLPRGLTTTPRQNGDIGVNARQLFVVREIPDVWSPTPVDEVRGSIPGGASSSEEDQLDLGIDDLGHSTGELETPIPSSPSSQEAQEAQEAQEVSFQTEEIDHANTER